MYREIKLRGGIINDKRLSILHQEKLHTTLNGVWNLSTEQVTKLAVFFNLLKIDDLNN